MKAGLLTLLFAISLLSSSQILAAPATPEAATPSSPEATDDSDANIGSFIIYIYDGIARLFEQVKAFPIRCHDDNYRIWFRVADGLTSNLFATHYQYVDLTPDELHEFFGYPEAACGSSNQGYLVKAWTNSVTNMLLAKGILTVHDGQLILNPDGAEKYQTCEGWRSCE